MEGEILERSSAFSLLSKEWTHAYYAFSGDHLLLFSNKEQYDRNPTQGRKSIRLTKKMHLKDVEVKAYKGYGDLYKFVLEEDIDHGTSTVARFAAFKEDAAQALHGNMARIIEDLKREAGMLDESTPKDAPEVAHATGSKPRAWGGLDG